MSGNFSTKQRLFAAVVITKKSCLRVFAASMRSDFCHHRKSALNVKLFSISLLWFLKVKPSLKKFSPAKKFQT